MRLTLPAFLIVAVTTICLFSCKRKVEDLKVENPNDYLPLAVGKYITYRLDSLVFTNFGRNQEIHSYQIKHVVDAQITDNLGRPSFRIYRFIRDVDGVQPWSSYGTFFVTPLSNKVEVVEDNMRFIKLASPIRQDFTWKGNQHLSNEPYASLFTFGNDDFMNRWEYYYERTNETFTYNQQQLDSVLSIIQVKELNVMDTADVVNNTVTIPSDSTKALYIRGTANDTIIINATQPALGFEDLGIHNQSNFVASFNNILIPPGLALNFRYTNNKWNFPNIINVQNNKVVFPRNNTYAYIFGEATDNILVDMNSVDTALIKTISVYNRSNKSAYLNGIVIPPGNGRDFQLISQQWTYYNNVNVLKAPAHFSDGMSFGFKNYSVEKYAKNLGLVYKELIMWEYQPHANPPYTSGFGITMRIIDHN